MPENGQIPNAYKDPQAFDHFNVQIHGGILLVYLITLQREKRTVGYFSASRFIRRSGEKTVEIGMNAAFFAERFIRETLSALAHDIVHRR